MFSHFNPSVINFSTSSLSTLNETRCDLIEQHVKRRLASEQPVMSRCSSAGQPAAIQLIPTFVTPSHPATTNRCSLGHPSPRAYMPRSARGIGEAGIDVIVRLRFAQFILWTRAVRYNTSRHLVLYQQIQGTTSSPCMKMAASPHVETRLGGACAFVEP